MNNQPNKFDSRYAVIYPEDESIYNILSSEVARKAKQKLYISKFCPLIPPTASTFCYKNSSIPYISNISGSMVIKNPVYSSIGQASTFGRPSGLCNKQPSGYLRKQTRCKVLPISRSVEILRPENKQNKVIFKPPIPSRLNQPIYGLKTSKNYLIANATEVILSAPTIKPEPIHYTRKKYYGEVPKYLETIKQQLAKEYECIRQISMQKEDQAKQQKVLLSEEEVYNLRCNLKKKWDQVHHDYQRYTHITNVSTIGLLRKFTFKQFNSLKEIKFGKRLDYFGKYLIRDMDILNKKYVFVDKMY